VIVPRVSLHNADHRDYTDATIDHLECFAREGYRTLVLAYRVLKEEEYQVIQLLKPENFVLLFFKVY
jgi:magnesium-transporting ATPase (P-type)